MYNNTDYMQYYLTYRLQLKNLRAKEAELRMFEHDIDEGLASVDLLDDNFRQQMLLQIQKLRTRLNTLTELINKIPETAELLPCKMFLRLHCIAGCSLTDTAAELGVSLSTLRRIRLRCEQYLSTLPPFDKA